MLLMGCVPLSWAGVGGRVAGVTHIGCVLWARMFHIFTHFKEPLEPSAPAEKMPDSGTV